MKPRQLHEGARIGIIAPASPMSSAKRIRALEYLYHLGYELVLGDSVFAEHGYLAGDDQLRANDLNTMFASTEIDAIFCLRGGYGSMRILPLIDYPIIARNPKPFVGYSDITALLLSIYQQTGLITFHGPMLGDISQPGSLCSWEVLLRLLSGELVNLIYSPYESFICITPGRARGKIVGGNLTLIASTLGTLAEIDTHEKILFLEDVNEPPYVIDRLLTQLKLAGKLQQAVGIIITSCNHCQPTPNKKSLQLEETITEVLAPLNIPCFMGLPIGHVTPNLTVPIGCMAETNTVTGTLQIMESCVTN